jgi:hypothetical protein
LPRDGPAVPAWDLYVTSRSVDCVKTGTFPAVNGTVELDLPDEAVFTLVGSLRK